MVIHAREGSGRDNFVYLKHLSGVVGIIPAISVGIFQMENLSLEKLDERNDLMYSF
jgi:hypothetical protein